MKVLYINRPKSDYVQDFTYTGLCKVIGDKNVLEYPWNPRFHFNLRKYPKNIGNRGRLISSLLKSKTNFDLVVVASCHPETIEYYEQIQDKIPAKTPIVFLDGGDWPEINGDLDRLGGSEKLQKLVSNRPFDHIFKRECLIDKDYDKNVHPFPMCYNMDLVPSLDNNQKYDVSFWAVESHPLRSEVFKILDGKFDCAENGTHTNQIMSKYKRKGDFYLQELARCKIVLNFRGAGWDTLRFWEVFGLGAFMISGKPGILIPNPFEHEKHVVYCEDDLSNLVELCQYYLKQPEKRLEIAKAGKKHLEQYHTDVVRAKFLLSKVTGQSNQ